MTSMTHGTLPTFEEFERAFETECPGGYNIVLGASDSRTCDGLKLGDGRYTVTALWDGIQEIVALPPDAITVSADEELEDVYQVFYPGTDKPYFTIGPDAEELKEWAQCFSDSPVESETRAIEALNYAEAYGSVGKDYTRHDEAMDLVSSILYTLKFEWI
jgi:hypothetical protein